MQAELSTPRPIAENNTLIENAKGGPIAIVTVESVRKVESIDYCGEAGGVTTVGDPEGVISRLRW